MAPGARTLGREGVAPRPVTTGYRVALAGLSITAIVVQLSRVIDRDGSVVHFFSYFTIQSNVLAIVSFLWATVASYRIVSHGLDRFRGAVVVYMLMTGVVYALLLSGRTAGADSTIAWVNTVVHRVMPVAVALDWLLDPPIERIGRREAAWWLAFPLVWTVYTLVRGPIVDWYPYPFIDPGMHGALGVAGYVGGIAVAFVVMIALVAWIGNLRRAG